MTFVWPPKCPGCGADLEDEIQETHNWDDCQCPNCRVWVTLDWDEQETEDGTDSWAFVVGVGDTYTK